MKNYQDSDYALNLHSSGIVYRLGDKLLTVTVEAYIAENPEKSEDDFLKLKAFSDADYLECDRSEYRQTWKNISLDAVQDTERCSTPSPEVELIDTPEEAKQTQTRTALAKKAWDKLTDIQRRRYYLHHIKGLSTWQIAKREGISQRSVMECLEAANKKIKNFLSAG